jgi:hypothetical protein
MMRLYSDNVSMVVVVAVAMINKILLYFCLLRFCQWMTFVNE